MKINSHKTNEKNTNYESSLKSCTRLLVVYFGALAIVYSVAIKVCFEPKTETNAHFRETNEQMVIQIVAHFRCCQIENETNLARLLAMSCG